MQHGRFIHSLLGGRLVATNLLEEDSRTAVEI